MCSPVHRVGGDVCAPICEAQHKRICVCVHVLVGSEGKQQRGQVAMRKPGNWMTRSTFLAEPGKTNAVKRACFCQNF